MKIEIMYATTCEISVIDRCGYHWSLWPNYKTLKEALEDAQQIIDNESSAFRSEDIETLFITDSNTGEILAECKPEDSESYEEPCEDWDYNEDMGFDPYMGCYSDDC